MASGLLVKLVFAATLSVFTAIGLLVFARRSRAASALDRRLGRLQATGTDPLLDIGSDEENASSFAQVVAESGLGWTMGMFAARAAMAATLGLILGAAIGSGFLAVTLSMAGVLVLWIIVRRARAARLRACDEQMPQALEIVALALRAGHALPSALRLAADEAPSPICHELRRACDEHALGRPIGEVLVAFGERLPGCEAVNTFVVAVLVLQETGGNLIAVIDRIVENARSRASYQARLRALTAEGRQSAKLLAMLPGAFAALAMMSDDSYADMLLYDSGGRFVLLVSGTLWLLGILWTRRLVRPMS
jgi:tight adherence protein B